MKIYHTETQEDYDALMVELKAKNKPTFSDNWWEMYKNRTTVYSYKSGTTCGNLEDAKRTYPDAEIIEYKADECVCMPKKITLNQAISDAINSPNHYAQGELEVIDILEDKLTPDEFMGFLKGNVTKYNFRETYKNQDEDIAKAEWYQLKLKEFVAKGKSIYSRVAKKFTRATGYKFDDEFVSKLESGELRIVEREEN